MDLSRRRFLKSAGAAGLASQMNVLASAAPRSAQGEGEAADAIGVLVDLPNCIGCRKCEYACQEAAGFPVAPIESFEDKSVLAEYRRPDPRAYTTINQYPGPSPDSAPIYVKSNCFHCLDPACASACLVGALHRQRNGAVVYDPGKCMGCRYCMVACPFEVPKYEYENALTPQVRKCTLCADRIAEVGRAPACATICPRECLTYGKRSELLAHARATIQRHPDRYVDHIYGEHEAGGTAWLYLSSVPFEQLGFLAVGQTPPGHRTEAVQHAIFKFFVPPIALYGLLGLCMWLTGPEVEPTENETGGSSPEKPRVRRTATKPLAALEGARP